jgi:hypothetical protein
MKADEDFSEDPRIRQPRATSKREFRVPRRHADQPAALRRCPPMVSYDIGSGATHPLLFAMSPRGRPSQFAVLERVPALPGSPEIDRRTVSPHGALIRSEHARVSSSSFHHSFPQAQSPSSSTPRLRPLFAIVNRLIHRFRLSQLPPRRLFDAFGILQKSHPLGCFAVFAAFTAEWAATDVAPPNQSVSRPSSLFRPGKDLHSSPFPPQSAPKPQPADAPGFPRGEKCPESFRATLSPPPNPIARCAILAAPFSPTPIRATALVDGTSWQPFRGA